MSEQTAAVVTDRHLACKPHRRRRRRTTSRRTGPARRLRAWRSLLLRTTLGTVGVEGQSDWQHERTEQPKGPGFFKLVFWKSWVWVIYENEGQPFKILSAKNSSLTLGGRSLFFVVGNFGLFIFYLLIFFMCKLVLYLTFLIVPHCRLCWIKK